MRDELAKQVYPVLQHGLKLKAKLDRGERPNLHAEQAELKRLLGSHSQPSPWGTGQNLSVTTGIETGRFLGVRYAMTCWLDELFINSAWSREWDENKLELALFQRQDRFWLFWEQAAQAETTPESADAVEAFLMCVLLGFRGKRAEDEPGVFREWVSAARARAGKGYGKELPAIPEIAPTSNVPVLDGVEGYRRMAKALGLTVLIAIFVVTFLIVLWIGKNT